MSDLEEVEIEKEGFDVIEEVEDEESVKDEIKFDL